MCDGMEAPTGFRNAVVRKALQRICVPFWIGESDEAGTLFRRPQTLIRDMGPVAIMTPTGAVTFHD